jgi:hypothetical protein
MKIEECVWKVHAIKESLEWIEAFNNHPEETKEAISSMNPKQRLEFQKDILRAMGIKPAEVFPSCKKTSTSRARKGMRHLSPLQCTLADVYQVLASKL